MRVVVIGAGSVGQVYGWHLHQGGAEIVFRVRPHHRERLEAGLTLYPWNRRDRDRPIRWRDYAVATTDQQAGFDAADVILIATPATALLSDGFLEGLVAASDTATLVVLQPGPAIPDHVEARAPKDRVVYGLISVSAWPAPLPGQDLPEPGEAWWFPWGGALGFSGATDRARTVVEALRRGGAPARLRDDVHVDQAFASPLLTFVVVPLELSGWSMADLRRDRPLLVAAHRAMQASWRAAEIRTGQRAPLGTRLLGPGLIAAILRFVLPLAPVDLETFLRVHYTKVAEQTPVLLQQRVDALRAAGVDPAPVAHLRERLLAHRAEAGASA